MKMRKCQAFSFLLFTSLGISTTQNLLEEMRILLHSILTIASLVPTSQVAISSKPVTGNIVYTLDTERTFLLNVPKSYDVEESYPLVLSFHGGQYISILILLLYVGLTW